MIFSHSFDFTDTVKKTVNHMPLPCGIIIGLAAGVLIAALISQDWQGTVVALKHTVLLTAIVFGGSSIWMLKHERRYERRLLQWMMGMLMIISILGFVPRIGIIFDIFHYIFIISSILFVFIIALNGYKMHNRGKF